MNKIIEIIVSPTGETRLETKGFTGGECKEASKFVEQAFDTPEPNAHTVFVPAPVGCIWDQRDALGWG